MPRPAGTCYRSVFEHSPDPIGVIRDAEFVDCNRALLNMFALNDRADFIGRRPGDPFSPPEQPDGEVSAVKAKRYLQQCIDEGRVSFPWTSRRINGDLFSSHVLLQTLDDSDSPAIAVYIQDVTRLKASDQAALDRKGYLRELLESSPVAFMVCDLETGLISKLNRAGRLLLGSSDRAWGDIRADELLAMPSDRFRFLRRLRTRGTASGELVLTRLDGTRFNAQVTWRYNPGNNSELLCWGVDITEQKRIQERLKDSELRFRELARSAPVGIYLTDERGECVYVNRMWQQMTGIGLDKAAGSGWTSSLHPEDRAEVMRKWQAFAGGGEPFDAEYRFLRPDGKTIWVAGLAVPFIDASGKVTGYLGTTSDITDIKRIGQELEWSRNEALRANEAKSELLSRMSHELRTPLNAILGFGQLLQLNSDNLTANQSDAVKHILSGGEHLLELIKDVLDFSRVNSGHLSLNVREVPTHAILQRSLALIRPLAEGAGVSLAAPADPPPDVLGDPNWLQQVMINLLSNAVKYNHRGGTVTVSGEASGGGRLRIHVEDSGEGIQPQDRNRLFKPFERLSAARPEIAGTGIGLALCKQLIELMGGSIGYESEPGKGSDFWFELRMADGSGPTRAD